MSAVIRTGLPRSEDLGTLRCKCCGQLTANVLAARFWKKVNKDGPIVRPELGPCWIWTGSIDIGGYGHLYFGGRGSKEAKAHRIAWLLVNGPIPNGLLVLHKCDNRPCIRPDHMFIGTAGDNARDAVAKGRWRMGERNGNAKLTDADVPEIRRRLAAGEKQRDLAAVFKVSQHLIGLVNRGHRGSGAVKPRQLKLNPEMVIHLRTRYAKGGVSHSQLATELGVSKSTIGQALSRRHWSDIE